MQDVYYNYDTLIPLKHMAAILAICYNLKYPGRTDEGQS